MNKDEIARLMKNIRRKIYTLKTKKLQKLDCGDRIKLCRMLKEMDACLDYLNHWQAAKCSIVLEACEIQTPVVPSIV